MGRKISKKIISMAAVVSLIWPPFMPKQVWAVQAPDAGALESLKRPSLNLPQAQRPDVKVGANDQPVSRVEDGPSIPVKGFRIHGQTIFSEDKLLSLLEESKGKDLTLAQLENLAARITSYFHQHGYLVAIAYIPPQDIKDGIVEIRVLPGTYGRIVINNKSAISEQIIINQMETVAAGSIIEGGKLERALLLITDLGGIRAHATLTPGQETGTSDLIIDIDPKPDAVVASIGADNDGNRFTGVTQGNISLTIENPAHRGDTFYIQGATAGTGLSSGAVSYQFPLAGPGKIGLTYSRLYYQLGEEYASQNGHSENTEVTYTYPFLRSRQKNIYGQFGYTHKQLEDRMGTVTDKSSEMFSLGLIGNSLDAHGGTTFSLKYSDGSLKSERLPVLSQNSAGNFGKWTGSISRQQFISDKTQLYWNFEGQGANQNLDSSEKISLGGVSRIRAYPSGEASGDDGYFMTAELRQLIGKPVPKTPIWQLASFFDYGQVKLNHNPPPETANERTLSGVGLGVIWSQPQDFLVRLDYAWKLRSDQAQADTDKSGRLWLQATKYFGPDTQSSAKEVPAGKQPTANMDSLNTEPATQEEIMDLAKRSVRLMEQGKFEDAYLILSEEYPRCAADNNINFLLGQCTYQLKKYDESAGYYRKLLAANPNLPRVRLELGRTFAGMGKISEARKEFDAVLATSPPPAVADNVRKFIQLLNAQKPLAIRTSVGMLYDSNVNADPDNIPYGIQTDGPQSDTARTVSLGIDTATRVFGNLSWQNNVSYSGTAYRTYSNFNIDDYSFYTGPVLTYTNTTLALPLTYRNTYIGGEKYSKAIGFAPQIQYSLSPQNVLVLAVTDMKQTYFGDSSGRSGNSVSVSLTDRHLVSPKGNTIELGLSQTRTLANLDQYSSSALGLRLSYTQPMGKDAWLKTQVSQTRTQYDGIFFPEFLAIKGIAPFAQNDVSNTFLINYGRRIGTFTASVNWNHFITKSNVEFSNLTRDMFNLELSKNF